MKFAIFNQKGGVGKTSVACNIAACFADQGKRTLVVDLDAQGNASHYLGFDSNLPTGKTISDFFQTTLGISIFGSSLAEYVQTTPVSDLFLLPADGRLFELQPKLEARYKIFKLRDAVNDLAASGNFTHVVFDCPPAMNFYSMSALMASDRVLIPFDCDAFAVAGLSEVIRVVNDVREDHNPSLEIAGVIVNQWIANARQSKSVIEKVRALGIKVFEPFLPTSVAMRESHDDRLPLVKSKPKHKLTENFITLARELS